MPAPAILRVVTRNRSGPGVSHSLTRLSFGRPIREQSINSHSGIEVIYHFQPGELFGLVWWKRKKNGRQHWILAILEAPCVPGLGQVIPDIYPAVLVHVIVDQHVPAGYEGNVDHLLYQIQRIRDRGIDPSRLPARYWQEVAIHIVYHGTLPEIPEEFDEGGEGMSCNF